jgi:hypothetical protein
MKTKTILIFIAALLAGCNDIPLFGDGGEDDPPDTQPPNWDPTFGNDRFFYFWRIQENQAGEEKGVIYRQEIQTTTPPEQFWIAPSGKCVGCHSVSKDGKYLAVVELSSRLGLDPTVHVVDVASQTEVALPGGAPTGTFTSWEPVDEGESSNRFVMASPNGLQIVSVSSGLLLTLTETTQGDRIPSMPSWGPDGRIVYAASRYGDPRIILYQEAELWSVRADGSEPPELVYSDPEHMAYFPEWAPNGKWISFTEGPAEPESSTFSSQQARIRVLNADTGLVIDPDDLNASSNVGRTWATWSAAGNRLTCGTADGSGDSDVFMTHWDPETGLDWNADRIDVISTDRFEHIPRWAP